jgi:RNA polymerase sigma-70 factor (ECF subfamily)
MEPSLPEGRRQFATTHWSVVLAAGRADGTRARRALDELCRTYWPPLYGFARRRGYSVEDAQDLTQEFFTRLLSSRDLVRVDPAKGRFRSFLLASMKNFLANEWHKARAQKRGGGVAPISIDADSAEEWYRREPADTITPERLFERRWALTLLQDTLAALQRDYDTDTRRALFAELKGTLSGELPATGYSDIAMRLGMSEGAVKVAAHRLRARYRDRLRAEVARTVASSDEIDEELRFLLAALGA